MNEINFLCPACGRRLTCDTASAGMQVACPQCKQTMIVPAPSAAPAAGLSLRIAGPPGATANYAPPSAPSPEAPPSAPPETCGLAIASLVCSCGGLPLSWLGTLPGIICGHLALKRLRSNPGLRGQRVAEAGLMVGYFLSVLWGLVLAAIVIPAVAGGVKAARAARQAAQAQGQMAEQYKEMMDDYDPAKLDDQPDGLGWTLDLGGPAIPDAPVSGRILGVTTPSPFVSLNAFNGLQLVFSDTVNSNNVSLALEFKDVGADEFSGHTLMVRRDDSVSVQPAGGWKGERPAISITRVDGTVTPPKVTGGSVPARYALRLEFGELKNNQLSGRVYFCVLDKQKSYVRGKFAVRVDVQARHRPASAAPRDMAPDAAGWTLDVAGASIPDTISGRIGGLTFKPRWVLLTQSGELEFCQGNNSLWPSQKFSLSLFFISHEPTDLAGKTISISPDRPQGLDKPRLTLEWHHPRTAFPERLSPEKYALRLEFGDFTNNKLSGQIYLCAVDSEKSFLRGKFQAAIPQSPAMPAQPNRPRNLPPGRRPATPSP